MIAAVVSPIKPEYPRYRLMEPGSDDLGELFELRHLDTEVAQMRKVDELARVRSFSRDYFDLYFIEVTA